MIDSQDPLFQLYLIYLRQAMLYRKLLRDPEKRQQYYIESSQEALAFAHVASSVFQNLPPPLREGKK